MVTNKEAIVESDPFINMKQLEPQFQTHLRAERLLLLGLTCAVCIVIALSIVYSPPFTTFTLFVAYATIFALVRLISRESKNVDRTATIYRESTFDQPFVSILIPAHNEESVIESVVKNMMTLEYPDFEVLVIDDRSTDGTAERVRNLLDSSESRIKIHTRPESAMPGKAAALNDGLRLTTGKLVAVLDADAQVEPDFIAKLVPFFANPLVGGVQAQKSLLNADKNVLTRCQQYEYGMDYHFQSARDTIRSAVELRGNGMMLRRTTLDELDGFNEHSIGEDLDLSTRMHLRNWDLRFVPSAVVKEEGATTFGALLKQRIRWTEASLIRYLENAQQILFHRKLALRTKLDASLFIFEFLAPLWLLLENITVIARLAAGQFTSQTVLYAAPVVLVMSAYLLYTSFMGIRAYQKATIVQTLKGTVMVGLYLFVLWLPIVVHLTFKILTGKERSLSWYKMPRYGTAQ